MVVYQVIAEFVLLANIVHDIDHASLVVLGEIDPSEDIDQEEHSDYRPAQYRTIGGQEKAQRSSCKNMQERQDGE